MANEFVSSRAEMIGCMPEWENPDYEADPAHLKPHPAAAATSKKIRLIGYNRVSSVEQLTHSDSYPAMERQLREYCERNPTLDLIEIYGDKGQSAKFIRNRPGYQAMRDRIFSDPEIDGVLVYMADRLNRDEASQSAFLKKLAKAGKVLIAVSENIDISSPEGMLAENIKGSVAQYTSSQLGKRIKDFKRTHKKAGNYQKHINPVFWEQEWGHVLTPPGQQGLVRPTDSMKEMYKGFSKKGEPYVLQLATKYEVSDRAIYKNVQIYRVWLQDEIYGDSQGVCKEGGFILGRGARVYTPKLPTEHFSHSPKKSEAIAFIRQHRADYPSVTKLCRAAGISKNSYYRWKAKGWL